MTLILTLNLTIRSKGDKLGFSVKMPSDNLTQLLLVITHRRFDKVINEDVFVLVMDYLDVKESDFGFCFTLEQCKQSYGTM